MDHFSDRLAAAIKARRSVVCVGLDPMLEGMPADLLDKYRPMAVEAGDDEAVAACFEAFCGGIIDAVADTAACVKPQAAFFEQYGAPGWKALGAVIRRAREHDLPVILDVKRGDIASTGAAYARAAFGGAAGFSVRPPVSPPTRSPPARTWATTRSSRWSSTVPEARASSF